MQHPAPSEISTAFASVSVIPASVTPATGRLPTQPIKKATLTAIRNLTSLLDKSAASATPTVTKTLPGALASSSRRLPRAVSPTIAMESDTKPELDYVGIHGYESDSPSPMSLHDSSHGVRSNLTEPRGSTGATQTGTSYTTHLLHPTFKQQISCVKRKRSPSLGDDPQGNEGVGTITAGIQKQKKVSLGGAGLRAKQQTEFDPDTYGVMAFHNAIFRLELFIYTFSYLRQVHPKIHPWRLGESIWSTNSWQSNGSLTGHGCGFVHGTPDDDQDFRRELTFHMPRLNWRYLDSKCGRQHTVGKTSRTLWSLLGTGLISEHVWTQFTHKVSFHPLLSLLIKGF
jgi:hypothetical protein